MLFLQNKKISVQFRSILIHTTLAFLKILQHIIVELIHSNLFFLWTIVEWNKLDLQYGKSTYNIFRNHLLKNIQILSNPIYNIHNPIGIRLLSRLRLELNNLNEHMFNHNFGSCTNPSCTSTLESTAHFFLHCIYTSISAKPS